jgi:aminoglycoside phosphotransferase (APT) family kinase protein
MPFSNVDPQAILESLGIHNARLERNLFGVETAVWRVEYGKSVYALRVFRVGENAKQARELIALKTATSAGILVPKVITHGTWQGNAVSLLSWLPGQMLGLEFIGKTEPERLSYLSEKLGRTLANIHCVSAPCGWQSEPHSWVKLAGEGELELQEHLLSLPLRSDALLHMDFHPFNVMIEGDIITGVLDWSGATSGDARADIAKFVTLAIFAPVSPRPGAPGRTPEEVILRQHIIKAFEKGYREISELPDDLSLFYAWAGAAIIHNVRSKIGKPGETVQEHHLDGVKRWTTEWKRKAGLEVEDELVAA